MSARTIRSLWITRKSIDAGFHPAEMIEAWDEWSIEENPEGWADACRHALSSIGSDLAAHRYIDINVSANSIDSAFDPVQVEGAAGESKP